MEGLVLITIIIMVIAELKDRSRMRHYNKTLDEMAKYKKEHGYYEHEEE